MVKISLDRLQAIMRQPQQIRNISICAHVDAGKTTLSDSLVSAAGLLAAKDAGDKCHMDTRPDERDRGITIKSTAISLFYEMSVPSAHASANTSVSSGVSGNASELTGEPIASSASVAMNPPSCGAHQEYVINMIDSPGHVDFSSEVTSALRVTDGTLVLIDCIDGICVQTGTVLRQALQERIRPVVHINKLDRMLIELNLDSESIYQRLSNLVSEVNSLIATYADEEVGDLQVSPEAGKVSFGSGYHCWALNLESYAEMLAQASTNQPEAQEKAKRVFLKRLWGDHFYDPDSGRWYTEPEIDGKRLVRGFCKYVLDPIKNLYRLVEEQDLEGINRVLGKFGKTVKANEFASAKGRKEQTRKVMQLFLPVGENVLSMIVKHLPSPLEAQKYRAPLLYTGQIEDQYGQSLTKCDAEGPLICYISKMIPTRDNSRFYAFGRVFSGTVKPGKVMVLESDYSPEEEGAKTNLQRPNISKVYLTIAAQFEPVNEITAGNIVSLAGVDKAITKTATLVEDGAFACSPLKDMKYSVSPVVRQAVEPKNPRDLPELIKGMDKLRKSCPLVECHVDTETGEYIIAAAGELHLEICLKDLSDFVKGSGLKVSDPVVSLRETISTESQQTCLAKSTNKHNRIWAKMRPLSEELCQAIENGVISATQDPKERTRILVDEFGWEREAAAKIWCFGPGGSGPNLIVDRTKGVESVTEVKQSIISAWQDYTNKGALCGEPVRGVCLEIEDLTFHSDNVHRGANQIMPMARRCFKACQLTANPQILEPIFLTEITTPEGDLGKVYGFVNRKRAVIIGEENRTGTPMYTVQAHLPVCESFGFTGELRSVTSGRAFPTMSFSHWEKYPGDPMEVDSRLYQMVEETRKRKKMKLGNPDLNDFLDRL